MGVEQLFRLPKTRREFLIDAGIIGALTFLGFTARSGLKTSDRPGPVLPRYGETKLLFPPEGNPPRLNLSPDVNTNLGNESAIAIQDTYMAFVGLFGYPTGMPGINVVLDDKIINVGSTKLEGTQDTILETSHPGHIRLNHKAINNSKFLEKFGKIQFLKLIISHALTHALQVNSDEIVTVDMGKGDSFSSIGYGMGLNCKASDGTSGVFYGAEESMGDYLARVCANKMGVNFQSLNMEYAFGAKALWDLFGQNEIIAGNLSALIQRGQTRGVFALIAGAPNPDLLTPKDFQTVFSFLVETYVAKDFGRLNEITKAMKMYRDNRNNGGVGILSDVFWARQFNLLSYTLARNPQLFKNPRV